MLELLNTIQSELYKIRKSRIFYVCSAMVILSAIWIVYKDTILTKPPEQCSSWIQSVNTVTTLFLSIASGFIITFLMQREYEDKTIINVLAAPTSRIIFILSKFVIWFVWYFLVLGISIIIYIMGGKFIYSDRFTMNEIRLLFEMVARTRILSFIASAPLLLVAVMQRRTFYPAIMCSLAFTGIELFSLMMPIKISVMIPWSAAMVLGYELAGKYIVYAYISIFIASVMGIFGACFVFRRQNQ